MRDALLYLELKDAIKCGDLGRVQIVLRFFFVMMSASGQHNYTNELLHLHCLLEHDLSRQARNAVLRHWMVNPTGRPGHFVEADLFQELQNY